MKEIGVVSTVTGNGKLVIRSKIGIPPPQVGTPLFDYRNRQIGKIVRIFGPVKAPFILIDPIIDKKSMFRVVGKTVYKG